MRAQIDRPPAYRGHRLIVRGSRLVAAQRGAEPGQQLVHRERLRHVVVGPGVERADLVARAGPGGQHLVLPGAEVDLQRSQQLRLVLDDENHGYRASGRPGELRLAGRRDRHGWLTTPTQDPGLADSWSRAMFSASTFTRGSPRKPSVLPWTWLSTSALTCSAGRCRAAATRLT